MSTAQAAPTRNLVPDRLAYHARTRPNDPALMARTPRGDFETITWAQYAATVRKFAAACIALGLEKGGVIGIQGESRAEWVLAAMGAMSAGGTAAGIYQTSTGEQAAYILRHSEALLAVIENLKQWHKLKAHLPSLPALRRVVLLDEADGLSAEDKALVSPAGGPLCQSFAEFLQSGAGHEAAVDERLAALRPEDLASIIYTSGTTGVPKGVLLSHHNIAWTATCVVEINETSDKDVVVSYLPLSHIAEQMFSLYLPLYIGARVYFTGGADRLRETLLVARPTLLLAVPRVWEKLQAAIAIKLAEAKPLQRRVIAWARDVGLRAGQYRFEHGKPFGLLALEEKLAERLLFSKLKAALGLDRVRLAVSSAAAIRKEVLEFFLSLQLPIREAYGQSECTGPLSSCLAKPGATRLGTVGRPLPGTTCRLGDDGEILLQGPNVFVGYLKDPEATAQALQDGWLHTGDIGEIDADGMLRITDRKKDLFKTSGGKYVAPQPLETQLQTIPVVAHAVIIGENRKYLTALLTLDRERAAAYAKQHELPTDPAELAVHPKVIALCQEYIDRLNSDRARYEQIKRFTILPGEFTLEQNEMTPTMKLRRKVILQRYAAPIEAMYPEERAGE
jgi:long-chain acyl-CoA synthetase